MVGYNSAKNWAIYFAIYCTVISACGQNTDKFNINSGNYYSIQLDTSEHVFVSNYVELRRTYGFFLQDPVMFSLSENRDTLFIQTQNRKFKAVRNNCAGEYVTPPRTFYQIDRKNQLIELKTDSVKIKFRKRFMI